MGMLETTLHLQEKKKLKCAQIPNKVLQLKGGSNKVGNVTCWETTTNCLNFQVQVKNTVVIQTVIARSLLLSYKSPYTVIQQM